MSVQFWVRPLSQRFGAHELDTLKQQLERQEVHTQMLDLDRSQDLELKPDGRTVQMDASLSGAVFRRICRSLSCGLKLLVDDLCGVSGRSIEDGGAGSASPFEAAQVYNSVLRSRFGFALEGKVLIHNTHTNSYEGLVSPSYKRLPNVEFLETVLEALTEGDTPYDFESASLSGRWLTIHAVGRELLWELPKMRLRVRRGLFFSNSETGEHSLQATSSLALDDGTRCLLPFSRQCRVRHAGKRFSARFSKAVRKAVGRELDSDWVQFTLSRLADRGLGFSGRESEEERDDRNFRIWRSALQMVGLQSSLASRVLRVALSNPAGVLEVEDDGRVWSRTAWAAATSLDIFYALLREATDCPIPARIRLERQAHRLLTSKQFLQD